MALYKFTSFIKNTSSMLCKRAMGVTAISNFSRLKPRKPVGGPSSKWVNSLNKEHSQIQKTMRCYSVLLSRIRHNQSYKNTQNTTNCVSSEEAQDAYKIINFFNDYWRNIHSEKINKLKNYSNTNENMLSNPKLEEISNKEDIILVNNDWINEQNRYLNIEKNMVNNIIISGISDDINNKIDNEFDKFDDEYEIDKLRLEHLSNQLYDKYLC